MKTGTVIAVLLLAGAGGFVLWASLGPPPAVPPPTPAGSGSEGAAPAPPADPGPGTDPVFSDAAQCKACHPGPWEEWSRSMHAKAWTDPEVRALSNNFRMTECLSCHVPQPIHFAPPGGRVFERSSGFETGVDCLSCHLLPDGGVAAGRDVPGAPCRPRKVATLREPVACAGCHNQHGLVTEHETLYRNPDPARGALLAQGRTESCLDCHAGPVERPAGKDGSPRTGIDHVFRGGHHEAVLRRALTLDARLEGGAVVAEVVNVGAGHRAPSDSRHRSFNLWVTVTTEAGLVVRDRAEIWEGRMYYRTPPRDNTNLRPGEKATARLELPAGMKGKVLVELVYALNPPKKERREVFVLQSKEIPFDTAR